MLEEDCCLRFRAFLKHRSGLQKLKTLKATSSRIAELKYPYEVRGRDLYEIMWF